MFVVKAVKCNTVTSEDVLKIVDWTTLLAYKIGKYYSTQKFGTKFIKMCTKKPDVSRVLPLPQWFFRALSCTSVLINFVKISTLLG